MNAAPPNMRVFDLEELIEANESSANDPDAVHTPRQIGSLLAGALAGTRIGLDNAAPSIVRTEDLTGSAHAGGHGPSFLTITADRLRELTPC